MKKRTGTEYLLFTEAFIVLAIARAMLVFLPFKRIAPWLGIMMAESQIEYDANKNEVLNNIGTAIARGSKYTPWRTKCFEQAIAAKVMLRMRKLPGTLYFGVLKDAAGNINAHAWLKSNNKIVTGGPDISQYTVVNWYHS